MQSARSSIRHFVETSQLRALNVKTNIFNPIYKTFHSAFSVFKKSRAWAVNGPAGNKEISLHSHTSF